MGVDERRRPIRVRSARLFQKWARWLSNTDITPNQISIFSVVAAAAAGLCLFALPMMSGATAWILPLLAAFLIELRLLCNMMDGLVAVEGGKATPAGEMFNDLPDRVADLLILVGAGYAITVVGWGDVLGWCAATFAIMTAYVRTMAVSIGAPADFGGPMAKPHRMHLLALACVLTALEPRLWTQSYILAATLIVIILGSIITVWKRARAAYLYLERDDDA